MEFGQVLFNISIWAIPVLIAITFHEAAHGYVALMFGDDTAKKEGRLSLNPIKHIDPIGTILLPGMLLLLKAPFVFGYAKPVPVDFRKLKSPKRDMIFVAAAGPLMNILLAVISALLFHVITFLPASAMQWAAHNLANSIQINILLAIFNLLPIPPLDGGRILVGLLPMPLARPLARVEPYGFLILLGLIMIPPMLGINLFSKILAGPLHFITKLIAPLAG
ncbi:MAG: site-2 protease family protein [Alphaproteobacteria bacterium]|nr:site-2 protease family protein [Alphaproteobacteria bacterium]MDP3533742.1 site-2 protease family protein [Alphaproteobacteria bacterium]